MRPEDYSSGLKPVERMIGPQVAPSALIRAASSAGEIGEGLGSGAAALCA